MAAVIGAAIVAIHAVIKVLAEAICVEINTPAFKCKICTTPQMCNRVTNNFDMGIFSKLELSYKISIKLMLNVHSHINAYQSIYGFLVLELHLTLQDWK